MLNNKKKILIIIIMIKSEILMLRFIRKIEIRNKYFVFFPPPFLSLLLSLPSSSLLLYQLQ